ncbi:hypothetical protein K438DRAFT_1765293 [Mycena galopus ATCC 62051]|nr:hypothetical protein K438DRAFT_1765293 [Mycena galopus ATCC 62051]
MCDNGAAFSSESVLSRILCCKECSVVICHYSPPRCQFFVDLDATHESATLKDEYSASLTGQNTPLHLLVNSEVGNFIDTPLTGPFHVNGYLGEPGKQLGRIIIGLEDIDKTLIHYLDDPAAVPETLVDIIAGQGVSNDDAEGLLFHEGPCSAVSWLNCRHVRK